LTLALFKGKDRVKSYFLLLSSREGLGVGLLKIIISLPFLNYLLSQTLSHYVKIVTWKEDTLLNYGLSNFLLDPEKTLVI